GAVAAVWLAPLVLGASAAALTPLEERDARRYVTRAAARLARVAPRVVAVTGSFGKTSTKSHLADLLGEGVVASPRSFNNRAGLSRAINELLADGTRVFIAEMGTYGPGEIRAMCEWCPPEVAVVTAIGPVHLERMGSLDAIDAAKFEVTERAAVVVLNADDDRLVAWGPRLIARGARVVFAGSSREGDVVVSGASGRWRVARHGRDLAEVDLAPGMHPTNVALAVAAALELGASEADVVSRLARLRVVESRSTLARSASVVVVIDDTFNANPAGASAALDLLASTDAARRVVVTPGLIELGDRAEHENRALAAHARAIGARVVVVGETNARYLTSADSTWVYTRADAVAWVRRETRDGDAVLYLNDLPDQYP
ncbi:MAG: Mur ligase family protein, partial [Acidimicrobiales bacterium]